MLKAAEVEVKKEHQVLMVNKTTKFKKGKGKKNFKKDGKGVAAPGKPVARKKSKNGPKPETECFYCKGSSHWKQNCPKYLADKKDGKVNKGICDIHVIMCTLLMLAVAPGYLILVLLLTFATRNRGYGLSEDWLRMR